jgi:hypothetical protein
MVDRSQAERDARDENSRGHYDSFAAQDSSVRGDVQQTQDRLTAAAQHYDSAAHLYAAAAREHLEASEALGPDARVGERRSAAADFGFAASDYWYAGRAFADALDFARAGESMEGAAACYVDEARLREQDGQTQQASILRVEATFRYLDAQRYFEQATGFRRNLAANLDAVGERQAAAEERAQAATLESRARDAAARVDEHGPNYHGGYQNAYRGADKSSYKS